MLAQEDLHFENYGFYQNLVKKGKQTIYTKDISDENIEEHFKNIIAILDDGVDDYDIQHLKIHVVFPDDECDLFIIQYMYTLMFWVLITCTHTEIMSYHLFFENVITKGTIKNYIDKWFIRKNMTTMDILNLNQNIDRCIGKFRSLENYQMYLCNTLDFKDTIDLMDKYPEFDKAIHFDPTGIPMEDLKSEGMKAMDVAIKYMTKSDEDHNLKYSWISKEGTNKGQAKEVIINIGTKPNGQGGVFQHAIPTSFINGGLQMVEDVVIDSSIGRIAQILQKQNVGQSGAFARRLGLNNQDTKLHIQPRYSCNTKNFEKVYIKDQEILDVFDMRYYRFKPNGMEYLLNKNTDKHLIGQTLLFRSPMKCASAAKGLGICYKCYGDLAYVNCNINVGQIAAEQLTAIYTQKLLSAKHLLESAIVKMKWVEEFHQFFNVEFDQIQLREDVDYRRITLRINADDIVENENEDDENGEFLSNGPEENYYVYQFYLQLPNGTEVVIKTEDADPIYISADLNEAMNAKGTDDNDDYLFELDKFVDKSLFIIDVQNDELSKTMKTVKNLIDNKSSIKQHDVNSILEAFISANLQGGIKINSVHFEVLLMNQIRAFDNLLELPDWEKSDEKCQIIPLENALTNNLRLNVRLQAPKLKRSLIHPSNRFLWRPSNMDLFTMPHPQDFMNRKFEDAKPDFEQQRKCITPIHFVTAATENPPIVDDTDDEEGDGE